MHSNYLAFPATRTALCADLRSNCKYSGHIQNVYLTRFAEPYLAIAHSGKYGGWFSDISVEPDLYQPG